MINNDKKSDFWTITIQIFSIISIALGLGFFIWSITKFICIYDIAENPTHDDMAETGQIGDFIGGVLSPIWSLTGILLFYIALKYQRDDLKMQVSELADTRMEFHANRVTTILYNQMIRIDDSIKLFSTDKISGYQLIIELNDLIEHDNSKLFKEIIDEKTIDIIRYNLYEISNHGSELELFISRLRDNITAISSVLNNSSLETSEQNQYRDLVRLNMGRELIMLLRKIRFSIRYYIGNLPANERLAEPAQQKFRIYNDVVQIFLSIDPLNN